MKPPRFALVSPSTLEETTSFLADHADDSRVLAGGQSLMPLLNMRLSRPEFVVDLNGVEGLGGIRRDNGTLTLGAMATQHELGESADVAATSPLLAETVPWIGHVPIRYRGTVGGSVAHADPAAELPAAMLTLDAELEAAGPGGRRTIPAADFYRGFLRTALEPGEILAAMRVPAAGPDAGASVQEYARRHGDFAVVGVMVQLAVSGETIGDARVTAFGVAGVPVRLTDAEGALNGAAPGEDAFAEAGALAAAAVEPDSDLHASAEYRKRLTDVLTRRAAAEAVGRATGSDGGER